jgi:hypothetical protein
MRIIKGIILIMIILLSFGCRKSYMLEKDGMSQELKGRFKIIECQKYYRYRFSSPIIELNIKSIENNNSFIIELDKEEQYIYFLEHRGDTIELPKYDYDVVYK